MLGQKRQLDIGIDTDGINQEQLIKKYKTDGNSKSSSLIKKLATKPVVPFTIDSETISITSFNGKRVYTKFNKRHDDGSANGVADDDDFDYDHNKHYYDEDSIRKRIELNRVEGKLLKQSIEDLKNEIDDLETKRLIELQHQQQLELKQQQQSTTAAVATSGTQQRIDNRLWVDKYAPTSFHELLSDDKMNKDILTWLKLWDHSVFGKPLPTKLMAEKKAANNSNTHFFQQKSRFGSSNMSGGSAATSNQGGAPGLDGNNLPQHKIILLTGGPGLGKTTLAHILAKQAGYNPVEINASDDRSGDKFETKFLSALEMKSVFMDKRPNCLIIDEIDGISGRDNGPIELILRLLANSKKSGAAAAAKKAGKDEDEDDGGDNGDDEENSLDKSKSKSTKKSGSSKSGSSSRINRPIICICNDQFVPSLRKLRQEALLFAFAKPKSTRLMSRLKEICQKEELKADDSALHQLVNMTGHDIRSCLNSLQFIKTRTAVLNSTVLKEKSMDNVIGQKDMERGLFDLWKGVFQGVSQSSTTNNQIESHNFQSLENEITSCTQFDKLLEGLYENYPANMTNDYTMDRTVECLDWFIYSDSTNDDRYKSLAPLAIHKKCSNVAPKLTYPHSDYDCYVQQKNTANTIDSFLLSEMVSPHIYHSLHRSAFVRDFISHFIDIISIPIRTVNPHLYNQKEKSSLNNLIRIMKYYNISYTLETSSTDSTLQYVLNPPIDTVIQMVKPDPTASTKRTAVSKHVQLTNAQKQIISLAVVQYREKNDETLMAAPAPATPAKTSAPAQSAKSLATPNKKDESSNQSPFKVPTPPSTPKPVATAPVLLDFFGRPIQLSPEQQTQKTEREAPRIRYRYQEGFTNAVKKSVYIKDFL
ncbi:hypothetical protein SAMD00019534_043170 [Acytostelium subglobosum LB1]|uniref:hypothetical protein n=1 Tax=Acytostelium subglobosum LB1 TaxID=1410327 RepID=UPI00064504AB|nr:hypothetical protein SAMD00019534_043170 [Acytostelium subglobosum LB1]GAM21142.1 hypothetical protein SAMD00019534_043170 [Acytostelium subglobosum LB1]|eukprot:XP_012756276.1 hypothetical protein SAMD00019534_043170 [Acytostelium subglobosum LB1]